MQAPVFCMEKRLIFAGNAESRLNLVSIVIGVFHTNDLADAAEFTEQPYALYLLVS